MKEARKVIEAHAEELSAAHTPKEGNRSYFVPIVQTELGRVVTEAHVVAFLDSCLFMEESALITNVANC